MSEKNLYRYSIKLKYDLWITHVRNVSEFFLKNGIFLERVKYHCILNLKLLKVFKVT